MKALSILDEERRNKEKELNQNKKERGVYKETVSLMKIGLENENDIYEKLKNLFPNRTEVNLRHLIKYYCKYIKEHKVI